MLDLIKSAIEERQTLELDYSAGVRSIEPHALGYGRNGQLLLRAFQTEGASDSGEHLNWKLFRVDRAASLRRNAGTFDGPRPGYKPGDKAMSGGVIAEL